MEPQGVRAPRPAFLMGGEGREGVLTELFSEEPPLERLNALTIVVTVHFVDPQVYDFYL